MLPLGLGGGVSRAAVRGPNSLPYPNLPAGVPTGSFPFDHIVVVMMENHSFDTYFGMLSRLGQPAADGFKFDGAGRPTNSNPLKNGYVLPFHAPSLCQPTVDQSWNATHAQIDGGKMDGFARNHEGSMGYYTNADIPFYYSLATTFTLANRWFCSTPCQTYPNRRFLMAGTAYGNITTDNQSLMDPPPPNGTIFDRLSQYGISWRNYFSDLPATGIIPSIPEKYPGNLAHIAQFYADCAAGSLPAVSFVDPEFGVASDVGGALPNAPGLTGTEGEVNAQGGDEETPQDIAFGENFVAQVVGAVLGSPAWPRTLLVYTYDEHGGYYDHVPPPPAIAPDDIPPRLTPTDVKGGYDSYGPRVPAIVVSPYSKPHAVTNTVHDHTSILATIEAQWNLPALTYRDANATTLADFLNPASSALIDPPALAAPSSITASEANCQTADPTLAIHAYPPGHKAAAKRHRKKHKKHKRHRRRARHRAAPRFTG